MGEPQVGDEFPIKVAFGEVRGIPVSMGNPHFVVFVDEFGPAWQGDAAEIGKHHDFKYGINVELVRVRDKENLEVRFYERGVGETQSSGTGSCAAAVASIFAKKAQSPVRVHAPGGAQTVRWEEQVFLRGPAQLICRGEFLVKPECHLAPKLNASSLRPCDLATTSALLRQQVISSVGILKRVARRFGKWGITRSTMTRFLI